MDKVAYCAWLGEFPDQDASSIAISEDGHLLGQWVSSSESWAHKDLPRAFRDWPEPLELRWVPKEELPPPCKGCEACRKVEEQKP